MPYGCNDNIKGVGNLSTPGCSEINVMSLFNTIPRTKRSHGHKRIQHPNVKKASKPRTLQDTFNDLLSNIQKPLGIHHIRTILFSLPVNYLKDLRDFGLVKGGHQTIQNTGMIQVIMYEEFEDTKRDNQNPYIEEDQTTQWPKEKVQRTNNDLQTYTQVYFECLQK
jgi:hypothetical protein